MRIGILLNEDQIAIAIGPKGQRAARVVDQEVGGACLLDRTRITPLAKRRKA
jgi:hypothetical protein